MTAPDDAALARAGVLTAGDKAALDDLGDSKTVAARTVLMAQGDERVALVLANEKRLRHQLAALRRAEAARDAEVAALRQACAKDTTRLRLDRNEQRKEVFRLRVALEQIVAVQRQNDSAIECYQIAANALAPRAAGEGR